MLRLLIASTLFTALLSGGNAKPLQHGAGSAGATPHAPAAVFTPYHVTPGGGEKYLLSVVRAMQTMGPQGYHVDILVQPDNVCQEKECIMDVAIELRVTLDPDAFTVHVVHREGFRIFAGPYDLFFALGNEKYAAVAGVGKVNMYMCQFPFDLDRQVPEEAPEAFATYDVVLLNSQYSLQWYYTYSVPQYHRLVSTKQLFPRMQVLHPPVTIISQSKSRALSRGNHVNIVMVGRFFAGRQSKGHPAAVKIFSELHSYLPEETNLIMVGNPVPGHAAYLDELNNQIRGFGLTDRIEIVLAASPDGVTSILKSGLVQWHLTGLGVEDDPASLEHFGISIVEGMSMGCIPIAFTGGAADIIQHGHEGFMASSVEQVVQFTKAIFAMTSKEQQDMQGRCKRKSHQFEYEVFEQKFHDLVNVTEQLKPDPPMTKRTVAALRK